QVWAAFEADAELRVGILTGSGVKSFSAGYDMKESGTPTKGSDFLAQRHPRGLGALTLRYDLTKPLIAAVNGFALGGGFELALACDIIVAAEHAEFGFPEPRVGRMALEGGMHRLARSIPLKTVAPLGGVTVLDFTQIELGPCATQVLGDFGADVIKIERPGAGDLSRVHMKHASGESAVFWSLNRNKRSVAIDVRAPLGRE